MSTTNTETLADLAREFARTLATDEAAQALAPFITGAQAGILADILRAVGDEAGAVRLDIEHTEANDPRDGVNVATRNVERGDEWSTGRVTRR